MDDLDIVRYANSLVDSSLGFEAKRGTLFMYLRQQGVEDDSSDAEVRGALEQLIRSIGTKRQRAELVTTIQMILDNRYTNKQGASLTDVVNLPQGRTGRFCGFLKTVSLSSNRSSMRSAVGAHR